MDLSFLPLETVVNSFSFLCCFPFCSSLLLIFPPFPLFSSTLFFLSLFVSFFLPFAPAKAIYTFFLTLLVLLSTFIRLIGTDFFRIRTPIFSSPDSSYFYCLLLACEAENSQPEAFLLNWLPRKDNLQRHFSPAVFSSPTISGSQIGFVLGEIWR